MNLKRWLVFGMLSCLCMFAMTVEAQQAKIPDPIYSVPQSSTAGSQYGYSPWQSQSAQLAKEYVKAETEDLKREFRKKLGDLLSQQFEQQAKQQQRELEELEHQIATLRATLKKRQDAKTTIIDRRIEQLLQEADGLGWSSPDNTRNRNYTVPVPSINAPQSDLPSKAERK